MTVAKFADGTKLIALAITISGLLLAIGWSYKEICDSTKTNDRQDISIYQLQTDMAVIKATTGRTEMDVREIKEILKERR